MILNDLTFNSFSEIALIARIILTESWARKARDD